MSALAFSHFVPLSRQQASPDTSITLTGEAITTLEVLVVTSSRQAQSLAHLAEAVAVLNDDTIKNISLGHPAELLNRV